MTPAGTWSPAGARLGARFEAGAGVDQVVLTGRLAGTTPAPYVVVVAGPAELAAYRRLRRHVFVGEQAMFERSDADDVDDDPRTRVLVARTPAGEVLGGVRVHPALPAVAGGRDLGWWRGSRLVVAPGVRGRLGVGPALVRSACASVEDLGALRFDATVQQRHGVLFTRLGWQVRGETVLHGHPHLEVAWPIGRVQRLVDATKADLGGLVGDLLRGADPAWLGDDGVPVPGTDAVAACDAILPSMVERDPHWAGWCGVLVNLNDLTAMGAHPVGLLDAVGARDASFARRVLRGVADASRAWGVPVLGGHTQLGVPASLAITALGRTTRPVPGAGGRPGHALRLTADLGGGWRAGHTGRQWDSTSHRTTAELRALGSVVADLAPAAAKDVSMSGVVGTAGMLAEASGCRAVLDVADVPTPATADLGDWLTCFPGFAMLTADRPGAGPDGPRPAPLPDGVVSRTCGELTTGSGVALRWPDGVVTEAAGAVTHLGAAS